jgi:hypothetical protein
MAEAGRECNERVRLQQLSLFNHRESDYVSALERRFFVTRHTRQAHPIGNPLNRALPQAATKPASRANIMRYARVATKQMQWLETFVVDVDRRGKQLWPQRQRYLAPSVAIATRSQCCCSRTDAGRFLFARGESASAAAMGSRAGRTAFRARPDSRIEDLVEHLDIVATQAR